jgi:hypothetical protein
VSQLEITRTIPLSFIYAPIGWYPDPSQPGLSPGVCCGLHAR